MIFLLLSIKIYFFYSPECPDCHFVKENLIKKIEDKYEIVYLTVDDPKNMKTLMEIEDRKKDYDNRIPVVYVGDSVFGSKEEIMEGLLKYLNILSDTTMLNPEEIDYITLLNPVKVLYFYSKGCRNCEIMEYKLKLLEKEMKGIIIESYDIRKSMSYLYNIEKEIGVKRNKIFQTPVVILNDEAFFNEDFYRLKEKILKVQESGNENYYERYSKENNLNELLGILKTGSIFIAGLIDGINPCAFATFVFLLSLFSLSGKRREIILSGTGFILSVYFTYLLIGLGIFSFIRSLLIFLILSRMVYLLSGIIAIIFGILSIVDILRIKKNKAMILKMPDSLKRLSRITARNIYTIPVIFFSSFLIGFIISLFEFTCTGQIYFPFITYLAQNPYLRLFAIKPLFIYNFGFVTPIILIFIFYLSGMREWELSRQITKKLIPIKVLTAIILFSLGIFILLF